MLALLLLPLPGKHYVDTYMWLIVSQEIRILFIISQRKYLIMNKQVIASSRKYLTLVIMKDN